MAALHPQSWVAALFLKGEYLGLLVEAVPLDEPMPRIDVSVQTKVRLELVRSKI